jgi:hypothetical protein
MLVILNLFPEPILRSNLHIGFARGLLKQVQHDMLLSKQSYKQLFLLSYQ